MIGIDMSIVYSSIDRISVICVFRSYMFCVVTDCYDIWLNLHCIYYLVCPNKCDPTDIPLILLCTTIQPECCMLTVRHQHKFDRQCKRARTLFTGRSTSQP